MIAAVGAIMAYGPRALQRQKELDFSLSDAPFTIATAALASIRCTGRTPTSIWDVIVSDPDRVPEVRALGVGYMPIFTPFGPHLQDERVLRKMSFTFPTSPNALAVTNGRLVSAANGEPACILSFDGAIRDGPFWVGANVYLWENWAKIFRGDITGEKQIDEYDCNNPCWLRIHAAVGAELPSDGQAFTP